MKNLITIIIMLVAVGCGKTEVETKTETKTETGKTEKKPLSPEEKLIGSYEIKNDGETKEFVLLENGKFEVWTHDEEEEEGTWKKEEEGTWKFEAKEVHFWVDGKEITYILRIEPNGHLTQVGRIEDNKRTDFPKEDQFTLKKVSKGEPLSPETSTQVLPSYAKLFGSYEIKFDVETKKLVLLENGKFEAWTDGEKEEKGTWKFEAKEVHVVIRNDRPVFKIEPNGDLTVIALIEDGKRTDIPKEDQATFKKIK